jgi:RNA polymerase sigma-32 factor
MKTQAIKKKPENKKIGKAVSKRRTDSPKAETGKSDKKTKQPAKASPRPKPSKADRPVKVAKPAAKAAVARLAKVRKSSKAPEPKKAIKPEKPAAEPEPREAEAEKEEKPSAGAAEEPAEKSGKAAKAQQADDSDKALIKFDPLQRYLSEISKYRLLTREEERDYGVRVKEQGDKEAAYALVTANLRLVVKIALEFQRVWMQNLLDLIQEGNIGLMQAVKKFDPYKNVKFSYYASFWIKAYILKFIMDNWRLVKIGTTQGQRKLFFKLKKEKQRLIDQGFDPKPKLLSERLGVSEREIVDMDQRLDGWDVSLDAPLKNDSETERIEFLSTDNESVEEQVSKKEIELLLHNKISEFRKKMSPREIEIFELRIFSDNPVTLQEIGDRYGISRERVRQIEKNIIRKMREFFKREIPDFASYSEDTGTE